VSSGIGFAPRAELSRYVTDAGFVIDDIEGYARGYSTPHVVFVAHVPSSVETSAATRPHAALRAP
jgi:hypothetical protein